MRVKESESAAKVDLKLNHRHIVGASEARVVKDAIPGVCFGRSTCPSTSITKIVIYTERIKVTHLQFHPRETMKSFSLIAVDLLVVVKVNLLSEG